jgi:hypothetical protein
MPEILIGIAVLVGILIFFQLFISASPRALANALRLTGVGALAVTAAVLFYLRQMTFGFVAASMAWGLYTQGHVWPSGWPGRGFPFLWWFPTGGSSRGSRRPRGRGPQAGQTSRVATAWLEIELNHDTGEMQGLVLQGKYARRTLASLPPANLLALYGEAGSADPETARLLEAYLDRRLGPEWRLQGQEQKTGERKEETPHRRRDSSMSRDEAYRVLGLQTGAAEAEIRAAHRKLMMQNHPDRGGSDYLASKINEAKDVLLG